MPGVVVSVAAVRRSERPAARGRKRKQCAARPQLRPAPRRAARRGASTDVSLDGGAALPSGLGRGQPHFTRPGAEQKRDPEPEQPPPWRVSPSGSPGNAGKDQNPLSPHRSGRAAKPLARPGPRGPRLASPALLGVLACPRARSAPLVPAPTHARRKGSPGSGEGFHVP